MQKIAYSPIVRWMGRCCLLLIAACTSETVEQPASSEKTTLFVQVPIACSGVRFTNQTTEDQLRNIVVYQYFYNGGGVATADFNNDGRTDLFFTANTGQPKLYLNRGNFQFEDITLLSGIGNPPNSWMTGVTVVDINQDGWLDLYLCRSGNLRPENRANLLYINNQDHTFSERAAEYGLADPGYSVQAAFFDFDRDGDLDCYLLNHGMEYYGRAPVANRNIRDPYIGDKLFRNDNSQYVDISEAAGIYGHSNGYGLGVGIADLNSDGWDDVYVANDFFEHDYLYFNQGDGTFRESIKDATQQISFFGMGVDIADYNNDTLPDVVVLDMTAPDHRRQKSNLAGISEEKFRDLVQKGYHYQYMYNSLHLNRGNGTFANAASLAGIAATDWSWAPLLADFDNDGWKDLYISNGLRKDVLNNDFINNLDNTLGKYSQPFLDLPENEAVRLLKDMPSEKVSNFFFRNNGDLTFQDATQASGLYLPSFSNGAAYADLDNDGDLDLIVNNLDEPAFLFENQSEKLSQNKAIQVKLMGKKGNVQGLGTKVYVQIGEQRQSHQLYLTRGFQSAVEGKLHIGVGSADKVDRLTIVWPTGEVAELANVSVGKELTIRQEEAKEQWKPTPKTTPIFRPITASIGLDFRHQENAFDDYDREFLLPYQLSGEGPALAVADTDGDGLDEVFVGGAKGQSGQLFRQTAQGLFRTQPGPWEKDRACEDVGALFFDMDADGDPDLYVASGGNEADNESPDMRHRLYRNEGNGRFTDATANLPNIRVSGKAVAAADIDSDGDLDLFVGGRQTPGHYPKAPRSYLLENTGGTFRDITESHAPQLLAPGMVTASVFADLNSDNAPELVIAGEWMPIQVFDNQQGTFSLSANANGLEQTSGWWQSLTPADLDGDGDTDWVAGNWGTNFFFRASAQAPFELYAGDADGNGSTDLLLGYWQNGKLWPVKERDAIQEQMPGTKRKFNHYASYAAATLPQLIDEEKIGQMAHYQAHTFSHMRLINEGGGKFAAVPLPAFAQLSPLMSTIVTDLNADGLPDLVGVGNRYQMDWDFPRCDAGAGVVLLGKGKGQLEAIPWQQSGLYAPGDTRQIVQVRTPNGLVWVVAQRDGKIMPFERGQ